MHECFETLKGKYVEVALTNQTLHGVLDDVVRVSPFFWCWKKRIIKKSWSTFSTLSLCGW